MTAAEPPRVVTIRRDVGCSPLWMIACAAPCAPDGWCMSRSKELPGGMCWLASARDEAGANDIARQWGWTVKP